MDIDNFKATIVKQYRDQLKLAYKASEKDGKFNSNLFNDRLFDLWTAARVDGLAQFDFKSLVSDCVNEHISDVEFPFTEKFAA